jgi:hypothetical protein
MEAYRQWRRQYLRKKQKEASVNTSRSVHDIKISYMNVIYKITDILLTVDLQDQEIVAVWKALKNMTAAVSGKGVGAKDGSRYIN